MFKMLVLRYLKLICSSYSTLFGVITKLVMLRAKNQALLQMPETPAAVSAIQFYENAQPNIKGTNGYVQFAPHRELTTVDQNQGQECEPNRFLLVMAHLMWDPIIVDMWKSL